MKTVIVIREIFSLKLLGNQQTISEAFWIRWAFIFSEDELHEEEGD